MVFRPFRLRIVAVIFTVALVVLCAVGWVALPPHLRAGFTFSQLLTLLAILGFLVFAMITMAASAVWADADGLLLRNGLRRHRVEWSRVHTILLRPGDPWALLLLKPSDGRPFQVDLDAEKRQLMGIQASDGPRAVRAVEELRARHRAFLASH
ncbi:hypothetical protein GCM10009841_18790 [Microlunatus panaciterrae]